MRISKDPEVRKKEILDVAMQVFAEKGYEATTMKDIARAANVVAGLCYHYFQNKQALYEAAAAQYAEKCCREFRRVFQKTELGLDQMIKELVKTVREQEKEYRYRDFFHQKGNEMFHRQLDYYIAREMLPAVEAYLCALNERKERTIEHPRLLARFLWEGQLAVMNDEETPLEERLAFLVKQMERI